MDDRIWLCHRDTGGTFYCPTAAADQWQQMGWEPCDPPQEANPAVAEQLAWRAEQDAKRATNQSPAAHAAPEPMKEK